MRGTYETHPASEPSVTAVDAGHGREFLVVSFRLPGDSKTIVFERQGSPECWVSRREVAGTFDPVAAVTGHLLASPEDDSVSLLKRQLCLERRANWTLREELRKLRDQMVARRAAGKRGVGHGRRNP